MYTEKQFICQLLLCYSAGALGKRLQLKIEYRKADDPPHLTFCKCETICYGDLSHFCLPFLINLSVFVFHLLEHPQSTFLVKVARRGEKAEEKSCSLCDNECPLQWNRHIGSRIDVCAVSYRARKHTHTLVTSHVCIHIHVSPTHFSIRGGWNKMADGLSRDWIHE